MNLMRSLHALRLVEMTGGRAVGMTIRAVGMTIRAVGMTEGVMIKAVE